jgi:hypothetical protein
MAQVFRNQTYHNPVNSLTLNQNGRLLAAATQKGVVSLFKTQNSSLPPTEHSETDSAGNLLRRETANIMTESNCN